MVDFGQVPTLECMPARGFFGIQYDTQYCFALKLLQLFYIVSVGATFLDECYYDHDVMILIRHLLIATFWSESRFHTDQCYYRIEYAH